MAVSSSFGGLYGFCFELAVINCVSICEKVSRKETHSAYCSRRRKCTLYSIMYNFSICNTELSRSFTLRHNVRYVVAVVRVHFHKTAIIHRCSLDVSTIMQCSRKRVRQLKKRIKSCFFDFEKKRTGRPTQPIVSQAT